MLKNQWERFWPLVAGTILVLVFLAAMFGSAFFEVVCGVKGDCARARDWIGALSGWVAAAGALYAAHLTLGPLLRQVDEAKRQTDFVVGDADPEFVVLRDRAKNVLKLRVTNWNRRAVMVDNITCVLPEDITVMLPNDVPSRRKEFFMDSITVRLRERGRVSGEPRLLVSLGHAKRRMLAEGEYARQRERVVARIADRKSRFIDDKARLQNLGGRSRFLEEEREFETILARNPTFSRAHFAGRKPDSTP